MAMPHVVLRALPLALLAAALFAPAAAAKTVSCEIGHYFPGRAPTSTTPQDLKAINLPRLTDGYAPRCLVAETLLNWALDDIAAGRKPRARIWARGARWNGGRWRCRYTTTGDHRNASCRQSGRPKRRVTYALHP
jgi:hypothetical protein